MQNKKNFHISQTTINERQKRTSQLILFKLRKVTCILQKLFQIRSFRPLDSGNEPI